MIVIPLPNGWGSAGCEQLPPFLNPYQLVAWVQYRDLAVVAKCSAQTGLAAQQIYGTESKVGRVGDAERAIRIYKRGMEEAKRAGDTHSYNELYGALEDLEE